MLFPFIQRARCPFPASTPKVSSFVVLQFGFSRFCICPARFLWHGEKCFPFFPRLSSARKRPRFAEGLRENFQLIKRTPVDRYLFERRAVLFADAIKRKQRFYRMFSFEIFSTLSVQKSNPRNSQIRPLQRLVYDGNIYSKRFSTGRKMNRVGETILATKSTFKHESKLSKRVRARPAKRHSVSFMEYQSCTYATCNLPAGNGHLRFHSPCQLIVVTDRATKTAIGVAPGDDDIRVNKHFNLRSQNCVPLTRFCWHKGVTNNFDFQPAALLSSSRHYLVTRTDQ